MKMIELQPIKESSKDFERLERLIRETLKKQIYIPILRALQLPADTVQNAPKSILLNEIASGRIQVRIGKVHEGRSKTVFTGKFSAETSRALLKLGATWDRKTNSFKVFTTDISPEWSEAIGQASTKFVARVEDVDHMMRKFLPAEIAGKVDATAALDSVLLKTDRTLQSTFKGIAITPELTPDQRRRIVEEWQDNLRLWIKDFTAEEIQKLRADIQKSVLSGNRFEAVRRSIQKSYGVTAAKAKFLARQETSLLLTKFKETRYTDAGINEYRWGCVAGSPSHPVRPSHKRLEGKTFSWNDPPITTEPSEPTRRNNPGQDYNCRCFAKPLVRFKEKPA